jgi:SAM-dependent methyltransferase
MDATVATPAGRSKRRPRHYSFPVCHVADDAMKAPRSRTPRLSATCAPYRYSPEYFAIFTRGAIQSAEIVLPLLKSWLKITSVADFGCGTGAWLSVWRQLGVREIVGCDGSYVELASLLFDPSRFIAADLTGAVRLGRRFDLVQSLEVAEHLPAVAAPSFVATLVAHAPVVLFSAASPGQGGEHHVNEQPLEHWRTLFRKHDFRLVDALRPRLVGQRQVPPWYRYNSVLFVHGSSLAQLDRRLRSHVVPDGMPSREYAPLAVRIRNRVLRYMPEPMVTWFAAAIRRSRRRYQ